MTKYALLGVAVAMVVGLCGWNLSAEPGTGKRSEETQTKIGVVKEVDVVGKKIVVMVARELTFIVTRKTKIHARGDAKELADIHVGQNVQVEYTRTGNNRSATNIAILASNDKPQEKPPKAGVGEKQVTVDVRGQKRTCSVHMPSGFGAARSLPLVIALHGSRGTGDGMAGITGFNALADRNGFIAAYPNGIVEPHSWNSLFGSVPGGEGVTADNVDDVAFMRALIDVLRASCSIDPNRVFVCGLSSGAHMSYRLAVELSDRIAAAGSIARPLA